MSTFKDKEEKDEAIVAAKKVVAESEGQAKVEAKEALAETEAATLEE